MWQPSADISVLSQRSNILKELRTFFYARSVLEVEVPILGSATVTDPFLDSVQCELNTKSYFLQTSPEYFMKRLLAAGLGDIFYLGKCFRDDEIGRSHNPEFTMLEWYRQGFDDRALAKELVDLILALKPGVGVFEKTYSELFIEHCGIDPISASVDELQNIAKTTCHVDWSDESKSTWLDLLFTHVIEPKLDAGLVVVFDYPKEQAALARLTKNNNGDIVARRFEVFFNGMELANGYWELCDPHEQRVRFEKNRLERKRLGKKDVAIDEKFMSSLASGLPECAGVALGVDRLIMCLLGEKHISHVQSFSINRV